MCKTLQGGISLKAWKKMKVIWGLILWMSRRGHCWRKNLSFSSNPRIKEVMGSGWYLKSYGGIRKIWAVVERKPQHFGDSSVMKSHQNQQKLWYGAGPGPERQALCAGEGRTREVTRVLWSPSCLTWIPDFKYITLYIVEACFYFDLFYLFSGFSLLEKESI